MIHVITKTIRRKREKGAMLNAELQYKEGLLKWTRYWRANIHRFLEDYIECTELKVFQKILLYLDRKSVV